MQHKKVMGLRDIVLYTVSAMLFMDQIAMAASIGATSLFWWGYVLIFLFVPLSMITSELGTAFPTNGGISTWVREAFGPRWGARVSWLYWVCNLIWMPSVYILFAGMFSTMFFPELGLWGQVFIGMGLAAFTAYFVTVPMNVGKWIPSIGAGLKLICVVVLAVGGIRYGLTYGFANDLSWGSLVPSSGYAIAAMGIMVYGVCGTEVASSCADEMSNPKRDIPRGLLISGVIVAAFNVLGTLGVLAAIPAEEAEITSIFTLSLYNIFADVPGGDFIATTIACFVLFTFFTNMVTWSMGSNRVAVDCANSGEFPKVMGIEHPKHKTPVGSAIIGAIVSCSILAAYGAMATTAEDLFWALLAFFAIILLMSYIAMVAAYGRLRFSSNAERPYKMPLSNTGAAIVAGFVGVHMFLAMVFFVYVPGEPIYWPFVGQVLAGVLLTVGYGEYMIRSQEKKRLVTLEDELNNAAVSS